MAALQSIRHHGALLIGAIGLALFAFIAEEFFRSLETSSAMSKQQAGAVFGEKLSIQDYQSLIEEATSATQMRAQSDVLTDEQQQQIREEVWRTFVFNTIIEHEANKLGLIVTTEEMQNAITEGTARSLSEMTAFINPQTGRFDYTGLQNFFKEYEKIKNTATSEQAEYFERFNRLWSYTEKNLRTELLMQKYQSLLIGSMIGNSIAGKAFYENASTNYTALVASIPTSAISDEEAKATDEDLKDAFKQYKEIFKIDQEIREVKYIDVQVQASNEDRKALEAKLHDGYNRMLEGEDLTSVVSSCNSELRYTNAPFTKAAFPMDIRQQLDSMSTGSMKAPYYNPSDNTLNTIKLVSKQELPDSILYRMIVVQGETEEATSQRCDSILKALNGGATFRKMAQTYGQPGDSAWVTSAQLQQGQIDDDGAKYITALNTSSTGSYNTLSISGVKVILQVLDRKSFTTKYNVAVIKVPVDFSKDTYNTELNKFNRFIAQNRTLEDIEKNAAKAGYAVRESNSLTCSTSNLNGIGDTKDVIRWIFDEAKKGDVSKLYECGNAKDHLLLVAVSDVHKKGYFNWDDKRIKEELTQLANAQVKSAAALKKLEGVKTIAEAKKKGAVVDTVSHISFLGTAFIPSTGTPEPILSGLVAKMKKGDVATIKGANGAYVVQLLNKENSNEQKYDAKQAQAQVAQMNQQSAFSTLIDVLSRKANIIDNRYKF